MRHSLAEDSRVTISPVLAGASPFMSVIETKNLLGSLPADLTEEMFETLLSRPGVHLERILSMGQATPKGTWYDQSKDEWVLLLQGSAKLRVEGQNDLISMTAGDSLWLPAHSRHRVEWTDPREVSIWLALHLDPKV